MQRDRLRREHNLAKLIVKASVEQGESDPYEKSSFSAIWFILGVLTKAMTVAVLLVLSTHQSYD